jgi:PP-loop superfamily ATP-utilizing enzyme
MKYICCYSGGHSSALVAVETVRRFGAENVILVNHDISPEVEHEDIKRFKVEVADYLGIPITYVNMDGWESMTPLDVSIKSKGFQFRVGQAICTCKL